MEARPYSPPQESHNIPNPTISERQWGSLLRASLRGNGKFPQSFFAQAVLLGDSMIQVLEDTGLPASHFWRQEPSDEMVVTMMGAGRRAFHKSHHVETGIQEPTKTALRNVWINDRAKAKDFLGGIAGVIDDYEGGVQTSRPIFISDARFGRAQENPLFKELVTTAATTIESPPVTDLADSYKAKIITFQEKFLQYARKPDIPSHYRAARLELLKELRILIHGAADLTKAAVADHFEEKHPRLGRRIQGMNNDNFFGEVKVMPFHPLGKLIAE